MALSSYCLFPRIAAHFIPQVLIEEERVAYYATWIKNRAEGPAERQGPIEIKMVRRA